MGWHRQFRRLGRVLRAVAESRQALRRNAGHFARQLPAEELRAGLPHPVELLRPAAAALSRLSSEAPGFIPCPPRPGMPHRNSIHLEQGEYETQSRIALAGYDA